MALGAAAETALRDHAKRAARCKEVRKAAWEALEAAGAVINGDTEHLWDPIIADHRVLDGIKKV